ncbi:MAG TPA: hemolysin family protein [Thermomicrobiaceae bacterium]|nr:hemolysin family protein [Thermomicrobiaceae bacterium]
MALQIAIILLLLGLEAFLAVSEISIVSVRRARLRALADEGNTRAGRVLALTENPAGFLATVQLGGTLAGFFISAIGAVSLVELSGRWLAAVSIPFFHDNADAIALIVVTVFLSFVTIVFGELLPRTAAVQRAEVLSLAVVRPIEFLSTLVHPLVALLTGTTNLILTALGVHRRATMPSVTQDELLVMLETAEDEGVVEAEEADLIEEAFQFGRTLVRSVMVPRVDVAAVESDVPVGEAVTRFFESGFSRMPVYRESLDTVVGILYVKDLFHLLWSEPASASQPVADVVRPAYFVPDSKPIDELLAELRARRTHIAICVDEFGGMAGLVTLEDLIEELVGDITDEFDPGYEPYHQVGPGAIEVDGRVTVPDLLDRLDLEPEEIGAYEAETLGGLIVDRLGRIPEAGDRVEIGALRLTVQGMVGHRVGPVLVEYPEPPAEEDDPAGAE